MQNRIREVLKEKKMTQAELGIASGLGETMISKIINKETDVQMSTAIKIAEALGVSVIDIFGAELKPEPIKQKSA